MATQGVGLGGRALLWPVGPGGEQQQEGSELRNRFLGVLLHTNPSHLVTKSLERA